MKLTKRQEKKQKKNEQMDMENKKMEEYLESAFHCKITYNCNNCLKEAYNALINNTDGYITDDDLIIASKGRLKHK